jgi:hypothetical protein
MGYHPWIVLKLLHNKNATEAQAAFSVSFLFFELSTTVAFFGIICAGTGVFLIQKETLFEREGKQTGWMCAYNMLACPRFFLYPSSVP